MTTQVKSTVSGGLISVDTSSFQTLCTALSDAGRQSVAVALSWSDAAMRLSQLKTQQAWCAGNAASDGAHCTVDYAALADRSLQMSSSLNAAGQEAIGLSDRLARAFNLYESAESAVRRVMTETLQAVTKTWPGYTLLGTAAFAAGGAVYSLGAEGSVNPIHMLNATTWAQEGLLSGFGAVIGGTSLAQGLLSTSEVSSAAGVIASVSAQANDKWQGDDLQVRQIEPGQDVVGAAASVSDALAGLHRLGTTRMEGGDGISYATIAISRYVDDDGCASWLVTVPGTDGQADSPFGWEQNIELMASDAQIRANADSARMVAEAMRMAGIGADEPVAIVGHSQGGIVAATIASDFADEFTVSHIVTAGSPIASHPVAEGTWVTAIEMDDELVAALDGSANPSNEYWLTVRGTLVDGSSAYLTGTDVDPQPDSYEITHWLQYHQAAYEDASGLGNPAVERHEAHFQQTVSGAYAGTTYWQGRMSAEGQGDGEGD